MSAPRRLALVVGQLQMGGAERQLYELAVRLDRGRYDPFVVCLSEVAEPYAGLLRRQGIAVDVLPRARHREAWRALRLARLLRGRGAHLAHSFLLAANAYTFAASWIAGLPGRPRPYIASSRTCIPPRGAWARVVHRRAFRSARAVIANSRRVMEFTRDQYGLPGGRIRVIRNGVDLAAGAPAAESARSAARAELGAAPGTVLIGSHGRLSPEKNLGLFLEVARRLGSPAGAEARFALVGDGPALASLRARAAALGVSGRVWFAGARLDVARVLAAFDIFVLTSDTEGLPNSVMEAMAAGLPVVATRAGGTEELVEEGRTGFLVERGDLEALVDRAGRLAADAELRRRMGAMGRARVEREFSVERMVEQTVGLYDEVLG